MARFIDPLVLLQPFQRPLDALFNRQRGFPAGGADFFGVEEDERVVPNPAFITAGVFKLWLQPKRAAEVANGVVDLNIFRRAEVVDLNAVFGFLRRALADDPGCDGVRGRTHDPRRAGSLR